MNTSPNEEHAAAGRADVAETPPAGCAGRYGPAASDTSGGRVAPEATIFVGRADGAEVSVGVEQRAEVGRSVVLLRISSPLLDTPAGACLGADEAHRLAAALSSAAFASVGRSPDGEFSPGTCSEGIRWAGTGSGAQTEEITAVEGTPAADLAAAIALLPAGAVLVDFSSDADVSLFFGPAGTLPATVTIPDIDQRAA